LLVLPGVMKALKKVHNRHDKEKAPHEGGAKSRKETTMDSESTLG
jgi:hypothetical protein